MKNSEYLQATCNSPSLILSSNDFQYKMSMCTLYSSVNCNLATCRNFLDSCPNYVKTFIDALAEHPKKYCGFEEYFHALVSLSGVTSPLTCIVMVDWWWCTHFWGVSVHLVELLHLSHWQILVAPVKYWDIAPSCEILRYWSRETRYLLIPSHTPVDCQTDQGISQPKKSLAKRIAKLQKVNPTNGATNHGGWQKYLQRAGT